MQFFVKTLGCRTNIAESEWLIKELIREGFTYSETKPQLVIVNSCTVTHVADRKTRQSIRSIKKQYPQSIIVVTGCGARNENISYDSMEEVDHVIPSIDQVKKTIIETYRHTSPSFDLDFKKDEVFHTRATVKVQEGCNSFCSYCIIPLVRGRERSIPLETVEHEISSCINDNVPEIVLTGTHLGHYGLDLDSDMNIGKLISHILRMGDDFRIRLSSIEPEKYSDSFYEIFENPRVCPHIHLCLQSGSQKVLEDMGREYLLSHFADIVNSLREIRPELAVTTDVIAGFPTETRAEFDNSKKFIEEVGFAKLHVFPYSVRPQTRAGYLDKSVPNAELTARSQELRTLSNELGRGFVQNNLNSEREVVFETETVGITDNYIKASVICPQIPGTIKKIKLISEIGPLRAEGIEIDK